MHLRESVSEIFKLRGWSRVKEFLCHIIYTLKNGNVNIYFRNYMEMFKEINYFLVTLTHFFWNRGKSSDWNRSGKSKSNLPLIIRYTILFLNLMKYVVSWPQVKIQINFKIKIIMITVSNCILTKGEIISCN